MTDFQMRKALIQGFSAVHNQDAQAFWIEELGLCQGLARVDLAFVNGHLHGYELKSERDTLDRLPHQSSIYGRCLDYVTVVVAELHVKKILQAVPAWWGISVAQAEGEEVAIEQYRPGELNRGVDPYALAQLLWRHEAMALLAEKELDAGVRSKPRATLWKKIASEISLAEISQTVRASLKSRQASRSGPLPK